MSNMVNDNLILEAQEYINSGELSSTGLDYAMASNLAHNDLEALWKNVIEARNLLRDE